MLSQKKETDREMDGYIGPIFTAKSEVAKISFIDGRFVEGERKLFEFAKYDRKGKKVEYIIQTAVVDPDCSGKEKFYHDEHGNIVAMDLYSSNEVLINRERYTYEYDQFYNWIKMICLKEVSIGDKKEFQPYEVVYRTIAYHSKP